MNVDWVQVELAGVNGLSIHFTFCNIRFTVLPVYKPHNSDINRFAVTLREYHNRTDRGKRTYYLEI